MRGAHNDDVWAVGGANAAAVLHWHDGAWETIDTTGLSNPLMGVWTDMDEDVWVAGLSGTVGYRNAHAYSWRTPTTQLDPAHYRSVWKHEDEIYFLGGNLLDTEGPWTGSILRYGTTPGLAQIVDCEAR